MTGGEDTKLKSKKWPECLQWRVFRTPNLQVMESVTFRLRGNIIIQYLLHINSYLAQSFDGLKHFVHIFIVQLFQYCGAIFYHPRINHL